VADYPNFVDYFTWVTTKQRVLVYDQHGKEVARGSVTAFLPASVILTLDDGGQAGYPVTRVRPLQSDDAPDPAVTALVAAGGAPDLVAAERLQHALTAAGFRLVPTSRVEPPGRGAARGAS